MLKDRAEASGEKKQDAEGEEIFLKVPKDQEGHI